MLIFELRTADLVYALHSIVIAICMYICGVTSSYFRFIFSLYHILTAYTGAMINGGSHCSHRHCRLRCLICESNKGDRLQLSEFVCCFSVLEIITVKHRIFLHV